MRVYNVLDYWYMSQGCCPMFQRWLGEFMLEAEHNVSSFCEDDYSGYELWEIQVIQYLQERLALGR